MKKLLLIVTPFILTACFKFSGKDVLYYEGKKSKPVFKVSRIWCSNCGCDAIEIKKMNGRKVEQAMLLNCTVGCPPGDKSYKVIYDYEGDVIKRKDFYILLKPKDAIKSDFPLSSMDKEMIAKAEHVKGEYFFQHYCIDIFSFSACRPTTEAYITPKLMGGMPR